MPPKVRISKEDIVNAALDIVKSSGADAINARNIASILNCSTQPIFSNFSTMDKLRLAVIEKADKLCDEYINKEIESGEYPSYKASGMAYIRFAKEQKELFKLLYMRDRSQEKNTAQMQLSEQMQSLIHESTGLEGDRQKLFHLEMWIYVHGIATMFATGFIDFDRELVSSMITDCYQGLKKRYEV